MYANGSEHERGYALLLVLGIIGLVLGMALIAFNLGTRNQAAETQLAVTKGQLTAAGQSQVRLFDQYVKAGWLKADCGNKRLVPTADAPDVVKGAQSGAGFRFTSCDPKALRTNKADAVFAANGGSAADCPKLPTSVEVTEANWEERYVVIRASTKPVGKHPVLGEIEPQHVRARIDLPPPPVPSFGLLVNDLECGMCHVKVNGDVASTSDVHPFHIWSRKPPIRWPALVNGDWYAHKTWNPNPEPEFVDVQFTGGKLFQNYTGPKLPGRMTGSGANRKFVPEFPRISHDTLAGFVSPDPFDCDTTKLIQKPTNTVMIGTKDKPIELEGDYRIKGDLVISGWYRGVGTIYVDGNVYIPFDLRAMRSIFPYPDNFDAAQKLAKDSVKNKKHDGLAIASKRSIIIGEFESHLTGNPKRYGVWFHPLTPKDKRGDKIGVRGIYSWFKGGQAGYEALFGRAFNCKTLSPNDGIVGSINVLEAYLYAENTIGGLARQNSFSINGGIIADNFHVVSNTHFCADAVHPIHKQSMKWSYINYDWRMKHGLQLLDKFGAYFMRE